MSEPCGDTFQLVLCAVKTYSIHELPSDADPRWEEWRKRPAIVKMMPLRGPCRIVTVDAPTELPEGWEGWLAIDAAGHPYPLHKDVQAAMYVEPCEHEFGALGAVSESYCIHCGATSKGNNEPQG